MKPLARWTAALALAAAGCGGGDASEMKGPIPMGSLPVVVVKAAQGKLPGVAFDSAWKEKVGKVETFGLRGKDKAGKPREVQVSREGKVLGVE